MMLVDNEGRVLELDKKPTPSQVETVPELSLDEIAAQEAQRQSTPKRKVTE